MIAYWGCVTVGAAAVAAITSWLYIHFILAVEMVESAELRKKEIGRRRRGMKAFFVCGTKPNVVHLDDAQRQ